jgi:hypothetical protein
MAMRTLEPLAAGVDSDLDLFAVMGQQRDLYAMYDDPRAALSPQARAAGNEVLAKMFGSPNASRAINPSDHAETGGRTG